MIHAHPNQQLCTAVWNQRAIEIVIFKQFADGAVSVLDWNRLGCGYFNGLSHKQLECIGFPERPHADGRVDVSGILELVRAKPVIR